MTATVIQLKRKYRTGKNYKGQSSTVRGNPSRPKRPLQLDKAQMAERKALNAASQEHQSHRVLVLENGAARFRWA